MFSITTKVRFMSVTTIFVMLLSLISISPAVAAGAPGSLDTAFGTDGKAIVDFGGTEGTSAMVLDSSGRIVLAGWDGDYPEINFGVARLNPDGTPDTTFGTNGYTTIDFDAPNAVTTADMDYSIALDASGRILVAGYADRIVQYSWPPKQERSNKFIVARLNTDGTLDSSFGEGGKAEFDIPERQVGYAFTMKIDETGRILLVGSSKVFLYSTEYYDIYNSDVTIVRLNPNGSIDESFGEYGFAVLDFGGNEAAYDMEFDASGRMIIAVGSDTLVDGEWVSSRFLITRVNSDGFVDSTFGQNGQTSYDFGYYNYPTSLELDDMGRIVVTGMAINYDEPYVDPAVVARFNSDGSFDETFGVGGYLDLDFGGFMALDKAGHILIAGGTPNESSDFAVLQLNEDGTPDANFDVDGLATIDFGGYDYATAIVLDEADHILLAGDTDANGTLDFALARLNASPTSIPMSMKGFYQPVDMDGVWNTVKGGSTVPLRFEVFDGEDEITDVSVINQPLQATEALCDGEQSDAVELVATGGTSLRYDETLGQFVYNWQTPKKPGYCYVVTVTLEDGTSLSANFKLK